MQEITKVTKKILYEGLNSGDRRVLEEKVKYVLWLISKEEESERLRFQYYEQLSGRRIY